MARSDELRLSPDHRDAFKDAVGYKAWVLMR